MTHQELKTKALARQNVKSEYDALEHEFSLLKQILTIENPSDSHNEKLRYVPEKSSFHFGASKNV
ncbi:MAG: hypothetical protein PHN45_10055 [Methylococcales bacterium]|nr:hypothetical protein [Methylococcales bacterium]MDD5755081.1 hypothetical protein [Methylococcales bacterium]